MLTQEKIKELFTYDESTGCLKWIKKKGIRGDGIIKYKHDEGYLRVAIDKKIYLAHRIIWCFIYGEFPSDGLEIDHINGKKDDNRIVNLRAVPHGINMTNSRLSTVNKSGFIGVCWNAKNKKWRAQISAGKIKHYLGEFDDIQDAAKAYSIAKKQLYPNMEFQNAHE